MNDYNFAKISKEIDLEERSIGLCTWIFLPHLAEFPDIKDDFW